MEFHFLNEKFGTINILFVILPNREGTHFIVTEVTRGETCRYLYKRLRSPDVTTWTKILGHSSPSTLSTCRSSDLGGTPFFGAERRSS